jgi:hypothetical protein
MFSFNYSPFFGKIVGNEKAQQFVAWVWTHNRAGGETIERERREKMEQFLCIIEDELSKNNIIDQKENWITKKLWHREMKKKPIQQKIVFSFARLGVENVCRMQILLF